MTNQGRRRAGDRAGRGATPRETAQSGTDPSSSAGGRTARRYAAGGRSAKRRRRGWRKFVSLKAFTLYFLGMVLAVLAGVSIAYAMTDVPAPNDFARSESTIVYWSDGKTELGRFSSQDRETVDISAIPQTCQDAVVAAEDRTFYENSGFNPLRTIQASIDYVRNSGSAEGGGASTITQQYVKNYYLTHEQTVTRKVKELFISVKIDRQLDKDDILASYLNTIWFGRGTYGVQTASKAYFGKPVSELNLSQCAGLASILRSPARYDPTLGKQNAERFRGRVDYVLDGMVEMGTLEPAKAEKVKPPAVLPEQKTNMYGGPNGYLLDLVRNELLDQGFTENELDTGGLRIVTTFERKAQAAALKAVRNERPTENADQLRIGLAAVDPGDGGVVAMYGGPDFVKRPFNDAVDGAVQGGSSVKPFALATALKQGISLESRYSGNTLEDPSLGPPVHNQNDTEYGGPVDLIQATEQSINTAYVDMTMQVGPDKVVETMESAGLPIPPPDQDTDDLRHNPRVSIGIAPTPAVDMAEAYATLAAGGRHADWYTVRSVTAPGGNVRYEADPQTQSVLDPDVVADTTYAMRQVVEGENGSGQAARELGRPSAGKTGTHEDLTAWFSGFTPQLAASVVYFRGSGETGGTVTLDGVAGMETFFAGEYPARTWTAFMKAALEGTEAEEFPERADVGEAVNPSPTPTPTPTDEPTPPGEDESGDESGDETGGDETGGDETGGDQTGGDETGGDETGGDETGGDETGGDETGGDETGGDETGGDETGGDETGGDETGGDQTGGDQTGGNETGGQWGEGGTEGGTDTGADTGTEDGTDTGSDTGTDTGSDTGTEWG